MQPGIWSAGSDGHRVEWSSLLSRRCETNRRCNNAGSTRHYTRADGASTSATLPGRKVLLGRVALDTGGRSAARGLSGSRWVRLRSTAEDRLRGCVDPLRRIPHRRLHPRHPNWHSLRRSRYRRGRGVSRNPERPARATPRGACERSLPPIPGGDLLVLSVRPYRHGQLPRLLLGHQQLHARYAPVQVARGGRQHRSADRHRPRRSPLHRVPRRRGSLLARAYLGSFCPARAGLARQDRFHGGPTGVRHARPHLRLRSFESTAAHGIVPGIRMRHTPTRFGRTRSSWSCFSSSLMDLDRTCRSWCAVSSPPPGPHRPVDGNLAHFAHERGIVLTHVRACDCGRGDHHWREASMTSAARESPGWPRSRSFRATLRLVSDAPAGPVLNLMWRRTTRRRIVARRRKREP